MLREVERRLGLAETMTALLADDRDQTRVLHSYADMARARMLMIAAGYEDWDDIDTLKAGSSLKACPRPLPQRAPI